MHVQQPLRTRPLVQIVDILRDQEQFPQPFGIEPRQRAVRGIGLDGFELGPSRVVECMDQGRVAGEGLGRRDILDAMAFPQPVRPPKGRETAFGRDAGAGQDDDVAHTCKAHPIS